MTCALSHGHRPIIFQCKFTTAVSQLSYQFLHGIFSDIFVLIIRCIIRTNKIFRTHHNTTRFIEIKTILLYIYVYNIIGLVTRKLSILNCSENTRFWFVIFLGIHRGLRCW